MENASKALLIAAGFLLAILLLSLFSLLFRQMGNSTAKVYSKLSEHDISEFNQKFINYEGRGINVVREDEEGNKITNPLTIQDVVTLINLAKDNNESYRFPTKIAIYMTTKSTENDLVSNDYIAILNSNKDNLPKYDCKTVHINSDTMLVDYVIIDIHP